MRNAYPTQRRGDADNNQKLAVSTVFCRLAAVMGQNSAGDLYIQIHETAVEPSAGAVPAFSFLSDAGRAYAFAMPNPVEMSACFIAVSTTANTYTAAVGAAVTIQALLAV